MVETNAQTPFNEPGVEFVTRQTQEVAGAAIVVSAGSLEQMVKDIRKQVALIALKRLATDDNQNDIGMPSA